MVHLIPRINAVYCGTNVEDPQGFSVLVNVRNSSYYPIILRKDLGNKTNIDYIPLGWFRLLVDGFARKKPEFHSRPFYLTFTLDTTYYDRCFLEYHGFFFPAGIISPMLLPRLFFYHHRHLKTEMDMVVTQNACHSVDQKDRDRSEGLGIKRVVLQQVFQNLGGKVPIEQIRRRRTSSK